MVPDPDRMRLHGGDITQLEVEAIVNAANASLAPGGGVCGAIFRAAGPGLIPACQAQAPCPTGEVRLTPGFNLSARYIIHAVGPVWGGGDQGEPDLLRRCYENIMRVCHEQHINSVAIPAISCGIYGYPINQAAPLAVQTVYEALRRSDWPRLALFCLYDEAARMHYERAMSSIKSA